MSPKRKPQQYHASLVHPKAFKYLPEVRGAKYDFASADVFPEKPIHLFHVFRPRDDEFQEALMTKDAAHPRGSVEFLKSCANFFARHGFDPEMLFESAEERGRTEEFVHISATPGILNAIEIIYDKICQFDEDGSRRFGAGEIEVKKALSKFRFKKDENVVMVFAPTFGYYLSQIIKKGMKYSIFETTEESGFLPTLRDLEEFDVALDSAGFELKPKVFLLCYPNNPTGAVMTREVAEKLLEIARKHNILIISDEVYINNDLYDQEKSHFSIGSLPDALSNVVTLTNLSKSSGLAGMATGMTVGDSNIIKIFNNFQGYPGVDQLVIERAIANDKIAQNYHDKVQGGYKENIKTLNEHLLPELNDKLSIIFQSPIDIRPKIKEPKYGNIYLLDFSDLKGKTFQGRVLKNGLDITKFLYKTASIAVVPGECFLLQPEEMLVRMSLGHEKEKFIEAFENLSKSLDEYIEQQSSVAMDTSYDDEVVEVSAASAAAASAASAESMLMDTSADAPPLEERPPSSPYNLRSRTGSEISRTGSGASRLGSRSASGEGKSSPFGSGSGKGSPRF